MYKLNIFARTSRSINIKYFKNIKKYIKNIENVLSLLGLVVMSYPRWGLATKPNPCRGLTPNIVVTSKTFGPGIVLRHKSL
jgi:hypothetical protein